MAPNARQIAKSSVFVTASYMLAKLSQFVSQIILARLLSPENFGIWGMVLVVHNSVRAVQRCGGG